MYSFNNISQNIINILSPLLIIENILPCRKIEMTLYEEGGDIPLESNTLELCQYVPFYTQDPRSSLYVKISGMPGFVDQKHLIVDCDRNNGVPMVTNQTILAYFDDSTTIIIIIIINPTTKKSCGCWCCWCCCGAVVVAESSKYANIVCNDEMAYLT
ncbi:hypothetical protein ACTFIW_009259 [Dictyostelium discoideum]